MFAPDWWPSGKAYIDKQLTDDEDDDGELEDDNWEAQPDGEEKGPELPRDHPCGLLLLVIYGMGLFWGLWFVYMATHRVVLFAVSWLSTKAYDRVVAAIVARNLTERS